MIAADTLFVEQVDYDEPSLSLTVLLSDGSTRVHRGIRRGLWEKLVSAEDVTAAYRQMSCDK